MKTVNCLLFLCVLVGICLSNRFSSTDVETNYDDDASVITSTKGESTFFNLHNPIRTFCFTLVQEK